MNDSTAAEGSCDLNARHSEMADERLDSRLATLDALHLVVAGSTTEVDNCWPDLRQVGQNSAAFSITGVVLGV